MTPVTVIRGAGPVVLGIPHAGTELPPDVTADLNATGRALTDTDWHIDRLYEGLLPEATIVRANAHRYVIDANRDPEGTSLYPGQNTTTLVPLTDFDGRPIWTRPPSEAAIANRRAAVHAPYHTALAEALMRAKARHGVAILFDCHSIRSRIPFLFEGVLPDFNIGTNEGRSCAAEVAEAVHEICNAASVYTTVRDGRFKGGWTTRHYGRPADGIHAIQMELAQSTYLATEAAPWVFDRAKARALRRHLRQMLTALADLAPKLGGFS
ncbi:N-formylglutamate deformylase [Roseobacter sinensis]|uniref:N-formylglutamate deformylase n=1 Tax=Roseobacter sinensis TaxID=2931391 RepID=A0ABT3BBI6_9RHOB|nr:N-formylglutamate deformylase [Roseobacter sp. WL0113]MCV3270774.1 N-formylglutamate deformylase [Roseobacter sp. WL0113]